MQKSFKITSFIGSGNDGMCSKITSTLEKQLVSKFTENVDISDYQRSDIMYCGGCKNCFLNGICYIDDDVNSIKNSILNSDLFIISTPVYAKNISGLTKSLIDRLSYWMHLMPLAGKYCVIIVSTYNNGLNEAISYLYEVMSFFGLTVVGVISFSKDYSAELLELQISFVVDCLIRLYKQKKCHSAFILEEKYKIYDSAYQTMDNYREKNNELKIWKKQGYLRKKSFSEIIKNKYK